MLLVAACSSSPSSGGSNTPGSTSFPGAFGSIPAQSGTPKSGGTLTYAENPGAGPNYIFPITPSANASVFDVYQFQYLMWRPLYWSPNGATPAIDPSLSLASAPTWSNGNKTVTINMDTNYTWSDGSPVDANDVIFFIDLVEASVKENPANFSNYTPGFFPDNVASAKALSKYVVQLQLTKAYNPQWFYEDELSLIIPLPSTAWAKSSDNGPQLDYTNPANAKAIYDYLNAASSSLATYSTNPLWKDVDGPYVLQSYDASNNGATLTANPHYALGAPHITTVQLVPFTDIASEFTQLKAGSLDVAYVDPSDLASVNQLRADGYNIFGYPDFGFEYMPYNFADTTGDWNNIISQLYVRQAFQDLADEAAWVHGIFHDAAVQGYGVVPQYPASPYQPANAITPLNPFSTSNAASLLKSHGWTMVGGTLTCTKPGTGSDECGSGIPSGTPLSFNLIYANSPANIGLQVNDWVGKAESIGIKVSTSEQSFNTIISNYADPSSPANDNKWAMEDFGGFTDSIYPTTLNLFNTGGTFNQGDFSNAQVNKDINNSVYSSNPNAVKTELSDVDAQYPGVWQPQPDLVYAWKNTISGPTKAFASLTQYFFNPEEMYYKS